MKTVTLLLVSILSFVLDRIDGLCAQNTSLSLMVLHAAHHIFSNYLWFGSLLAFDPRTHAIVALITLLGWMCFGWKCFVSMYYNAKCGNPEDLHHNDLMYRLSKRFGFKYSWIILVVFLYDFYLIN